LQAAILNKRFSRYSEVIKRRRSIATIYQENLGNLQEFQLPPKPEQIGDHFDVFQNYEIQADRRDELKKHLAEKNIGTIIQWGGRGVHQWEGLGFTQKLPKVEKFFEQCLMLPINMFISDDDVQYVCDTINRFYGN
jgi:dTDP-4-amino-4,6-dideoxygalactose transaminase